MPLFEVQTVLAQLYSDSDFRRRFFESPSQACSEFLLTPEDLKYLQKLDREQVDRFAKSLLNKRTGLVRELLPALVSALGSTFGSHFAAYSHQNPSIPEPLDDSRSFLAFLSKDPPKAPVFVSALLRLELLRIALLQADRIKRQSQPIWRPRMTCRAMITMFDYDMETVYAALLKGILPESKLERCTILIGNVNGHIKLRRLNEPTTCLLKLCNGGHTVEEITESAADSLALAGADRLRFAVEATAFLGQLSDCGLLG